MSDPRYRRLAETLVGWSCRLEPGDAVLIEAIDVPHEFTVELIRTAREAGAHPIVSLKSQVVQRALLREVSEESAEIVAAAESTAMKAVDAYIGIRGSDNVSELSDVPPERMRRWEAKVWKPVHLEIRVPHTRWVVLRWPSASMAQLANRSTEAFRDFYFEVCAFDYERLSAALTPLRELVERTDRVRITAPDTDIEFSIRDIPVLQADGRHNVPDGEVFTAPVRDSVNGTIRYNAPTLYQGVTHENVRLTFEGGKIVEATSSRPDHLREVLDTDEGARYVGEFAIGVNPLITEPMKDILFDEKISGSIHLTPGNAYDVAFNGNRSQIHWDLVLIQRPEYGGGEIRFDGELVRKDGRFVVPELEGLNPEALLR